MNIQGGKVKQGQAAKEKLSNEIDLFCGMGLDVD